MAMTTNSNEEMRNEVQAVENQEAAVQQPTENQTEEKQGLWAKTKATAVKVHNSKPAKIGRKVALFAAGVGAGIAGAVVFGSKKSESNQDDDQEVVETTATEESAE